MLGGDGAMGAGQWEFYAFGIWALDIRYSALGRWALVSVHFSLGIVLGIRRSAVGFMHRASCIEHEALYIGHLSLDV